MNLSELMTELRRRPDDRRLLGQIASAAGSLIARSEKDPLAMLSELLRGLQIAPPSENLENSAYRSALEDVFASMQGTLGAVARTAAISAHVRNDPYYPRILRTLSGEPCYWSEIVAVHGDNSDVKSALVILIGMGLVRREPSLEDDWSEVYSLTANGKDVLAKL